LKVAWFDYAIKLAIGYLILIYSMDLFLLYALLVVLFEIDNAANKLRKITRAKWHMEHAEIATLLADRNIGTAEIQNTLYKIRQTSGEDEWKKLGDDIRGTIGDYRYLETLSDEDYEKHFKKKRGETPS
jgi:hypothetical protein